MKGGIRVLFLIFFNLIAHDRVVGNKVVLDGGQVHLKSNVLREGRLTHSWKPHRHYEKLLNCPHLIFIILKQVFKKLQ